MAYSNQWILRNVPATTREQVRALAYYRQESMATIISSAVYDYYLKAINEHPAIARLRELGDGD